jgi:hypothetical protein
MPKAQLVTTDAVPLSTGISILPALALVPQLEPFKAVATNLEAQAERAVIDSEDAWQRGSNFLSVCTDNWEQMEDLRKAVKGPIDDYAAFIQALFKPIQSRIAAAKQSVSGRMLTFQRAEEAQRRAAAEAVRKANEEAALRLAAAAEESGDVSTAAAIMDVAVMAPWPHPAARLGGTNTFGKSTGVAKRWTASVEAPMQLLAAIIAGHIPMSVIEWKQAELNKVATALKVQKSVHGLKIFQTESLQQR